MPELLDIFDKVKLVVYSISCFMLFGLKLSHVKAELPDFSHDFWIEDIVSTLPNGSYIRELRSALQDVPDQCRNDFCPAEATWNYERGTFNWPVVAIGYRYVMRCPYAVGPQPVYATRDCRLVTTNETIAEWSAPEIYYCPGPPLVEICRRMAEEEGDARWGGLDFRQWTMDKFRLLAETAERWGDRTLFHENGLLLTRLWEEFVVQSQDPLYPGLTLEEVRILLDVLDLFFLPDWSLNKLQTVSAVFALGNIVPPPSEVGRLELTSQTVDYTVVRMLEGTVATSVEQSSTNITGLDILVGASSVEIEVPSKDSLGPVREVLVRYTYIRDMYRQADRYPDVINRTWAVPDFSTTTTTTTTPSQAKTFPPPPPPPPFSDDGGAVLLPLKQAEGDLSSVTTSADYPLGVRKRRALEQESDICQPIFPPSTVVHNFAVYYVSVATEMIYAPFMGPLAYTEISHLTPGGDATRHECKTNVSWTLFDLNLELIASVVYVQCAVSPVVGNGGMELAGREWFVNFCQTIIDEINYTVQCKCEVTGFVGLFGVRNARAIVPPSSSTPSQKPGGYDRILGFTYVYEVWVAGLVFVCLSAVCLLLTVLSYVIFSKTRRGTATTILLNLCLALLLFYALTILLSFLPAKSTSTGVGCAVTSALTYYLLFVTLMWNAVEGVNMYLKLVRVFNSHISKFVLKAGIVAYGLPAVMLATVLLADHKAFDGHYVDCNFTCSWKPTTLYYGYLLPMCAIMVTNMVIFILVMTVIGKHGQGAGKDKKQTHKSRLIGAVAMLFLLGLPWVLSGFGALDGTRFNAVSIIQGVIQVIFVLLTGLQGVFIFLFHCARNADVRAEWSSALSRSRTHSTSSHKSHSSQSTGHKSKPGTSASMENSSTAIKEDKNRMDIDPEISPADKNDLQQTTGGHGSTVSPPRDCEDVVIQTGSDTKTDDMTAL